METTEPSQTEALLKDLSSETLTTEYNALKAKYDELVKQDQLSKQELEKVRVQLEETQRMSALQQREKEAVQNKLEDITNNKHESVSMVSNLRQSLALLRSENAKLSQETKDYSLKVIKVQVEKDAEHYMNESLKLQVNSLHSQLNNLIRSEETLRKTLLRAEGEVKVQNECMKREREQALSQRKYLEKNCESLTSTVQELREELAKCKIDAESSEERAKTAEERCQKMEANKITIKKNHDNLIALYERQRVEAEEKIANFSADLEAIQQKSTQERSKLEEKNKQLQDQLTETMDRLQVTRSSVEKLIGKEPSDKENTKPAPSAVSSNLLKLMKQYESTGRHWDDIYSDYFQLRDSTARLTAMNSELTSVNKQLVRERDNQQQYNDQLESEIERLRNERLTHDSLRDELSKLKKSNTQQVSKFTEQVSRLEQKNEDLTASLNDTTYQLRYLLRHVQSQYGSLPAEVQESSDLLGSADIPSTLGHSKTVFRDIAELQQRNQELMTEVRNISAQLEQKSAEAQMNATTAKENHDRLSNASAQYSTLIREQNEKLQALELRLSMTVAERDRLLDQSPSEISTVIPSSSSSVPVDVEEKFRLSEQRYNELVAETDAYKQEMEEELKEHRQELSKIRSEATSTRQEYNRKLLELDQVKQRNIGLRQISDSKKKEIDDLQQRASAREGHIGELEARILSLHNEIVQLKQQMETLRNEHLYVSAQLKGSEACYQRLLVENKELTNERQSLTTLLQNMNESLGSSASGNTHLVDELKQHNERLSRELQHLRETLATKDKELRGLQTIDQSEWKDKYQTTSGELKQLKTTYLELEKQLASANQDRIIAQTKLRETLQKVETNTSDDVENINGDMKNASVGALAEQAKQLNEANTVIMSLKKDLFDYKDRLADADATANRITEEYNKFATDSQNRIEKLSEDLASSNEKIDHLQSEMEKMLLEQKETKAAHSASEHQWELMKSALDEENGRLRAQFEASSQQISELQAELQRNIEQLQQSEQRHQAEVAARAEDADTIAKLRDDVQRLNMDISTSKSEVLGAQDRLRSAELSYRNQKEQLENTQNDMKLRLEESQKQQEALSAKIQELLAKVNELRSSPGSVEDASITALADSATQQLRDVSASLRREKDIWQARCVEAQQRVTRVESDLEFVQHQLSTTRALLENVRAEKDASAKKQLQGIKDANNEATLFREQNNSLRANVEQLKQRVTELESLLAAKEAELEPLSLKTRELEHELKQSKETIQHFEKQQEQWTSRSALLLSKHNKSDPQELERLKGELETAKTQLEEKTNALDAVQKQLDEARKKLADNEEQIKKLTETANHRGKLAFEYRKKVNELEASIKEQQGKENTDKVKELEEALAKQKEEHSGLSTKYGNLLARARQLMQDKKTLTASVEPLKTEKEEVSKQLEAINTEIEEIKTKLAAKTEEAATLSVELGRIKAMHSMTNNKNEKLKRELATLQQKLESSTSTAVSTTTTPVPQVQAEKVAIPPTSAVVKSTPISAASPPTASSSPTVTATTPPLATQNASPVPVTVKDELTTPKETDASNASKRSPEEELEDQPPAKK